MPELAVHMSVLITAHSCGTKKAENSSDNLANLSC